MNQEKIREVALKVAREVDPDTEIEMLPGLVEFLTRCLAELSKEPVAWIDKRSLDWHIENDAKTSLGVWRNKGAVNTKGSVPTPLYLHPLLTEQDKLDAARYRWLRELAAREGWNILGGELNRANNFDSAIDRAMENRERVLDRGLENAK
jgi:hypothetical protein